MKFHENSGEDYYDSFSSKREKDRERELFKKIREAMDLFYQNNGDFKSAEGREVLSIIIAEEVEEYFSDISE